MNPWFDSARAKYDNCGKRGLNSRRQAHEIYTEPVAFRMPPFQTEAENAVKRCPYANGPFPANAN
jgi:hypothetical protein